MGRSTTTKSSRAWRRPLAMAACLSASAGGRGGGTAAAFSTSKVARRKKASQPPPDLRLHLRVRPASARSVPGDRRPPPPPSSSSSPFRPAGRRTVLVALDAASSSSNGEAEAGSPLESSTIVVSSSPRSKLRQITGFSLTALRTTLRSITGFSLTASRAALRAFTGLSLSGLVSSTVRRLLGILTPGMRYFLQPFLIAYYAPAMLVRYWMVGPSKEYVEESLRGHERVVEGWRKAVEAAERATGGGYWPVHVNDDGTIVTSLPPDPNDVLDLADGIERSVAAATAGGSEASSS